MIEITIFNQFKLQWRTTYIKKLWFSRITLFYCTSTVILLHIFAVYNKIIVKIFFDLKNNDFLTKMVKINFFSQILTFIVSKLYSVCFENFFEVHYMSVCQKLTMLKIWAIPPSHFWVSATSRLLLKTLCNSGGWSMKTYDLICLGNLSLGIFRVPHGTVPQKAHI